MTYPIDPNVLYVVLLASLWVSVTAVYLPGTGVVEILAFVGVVGSILLLAAMPTNWLAAVALVVGVMGFLSFPFLNRKWANLAMLGLILQFIGSFTLFNGLAVSPALIIVIIGISLLYHRFVLMPALETQHAAPAMQEDKPIVGEYGYVQKQLDPVGTVLVRGESWTARADEPIASGTEIVVVEREGLTLFVEPLKHKRETNAPDLTERMEG